MATSFRFELKKKANKAGKHAIYLRITQDRKLKRVKTTIELDSVKDWNADKQKIRSSEPNAKKWNQVLEEELEKAKATYRLLKEEGIATTDKLKEALQADCTSKSFLQYAKERTQEIYDGGGIANYKKYVGFCNKLEAFLTDKQGRVKELMFAELTPAFLGRFEAFLHTWKNQKHYGKKLNQNTVFEQFKIFKALINRAITIERLMKVDQNPFLNYKCKQEKTKKEKLTKEELQALLDLQLEKGSIIWHARNTFFFCFYCAGTRISDYLRLRWCNISKGRTEIRMSFEMGKNHKQRDLKLVDQAIEILMCYYREDSKPTDFIFPFLDNNAPWAKAITLAEIDTMSPRLKEIMHNAIGNKTAKVNKYLKKLAKMAGVNKNISTHISRHSFAKIAKEEGIDNLTVKEMLGHSKLQVTETYMGSFDTSVQDEALEKIFASNISTTSSPSEDLIAQLNKLSPEERASILEQFKQNN